MKKFNVTAAAIFLIAASIICFTSGEGQLKKPCTECGSGVAAHLKYTARLCTADQDTLCCQYPTDMDIDGVCQDRQGEIMDPSSSSLTETADGTGIAIGAAIGSVVALLLLVVGAIILWYRRRKQRKWNPRKEASKTKNSVESISMTQMDEAALNMITVT